MGIFSRSIGFQALSMEDPAQPLLPASALFESLGLGRSDAGIMVNEKQALRLTTAFGCIKIISEDLSRLSLDIFQTMPDDSIRLAKEHSLYKLLHVRPNANMSSTIWRAAMIASACSNGNAYSWIKRDRAARAIALVPLASQKTHPVMIEGKLMYATTQTDNGQATFIEPDNIIHLMGTSLDGIVGMSPIGTCKNAFGLGLAAEKFGAQFFGNGARSTGIFMHPGALDEEAQENIKKSLHEVATGETALRPMVLEEGMTWKPLTIPPNEAQFLETRKFQKEEIACLYRVPMHLLQDLTRSTNNNIEHQGLDYTRFCLAPWAVKLEQEINYKLLAGTFFCEHNLNELQRGDFASQTAGYATLRNIGVISTNGILRALRMNPVPAEDGGDMLIIQGANVALSSLLGDPSEPEADAAGETETEEPAASIREQQIMAAFKPLFRDAVGRISKRDDKSLADGKFARMALRPIIIAMTEAMLTMRTGVGTITEADETRADALADLAAAGIAMGGDKAAMANDATRLVYGRLAAEVIVNG